MEKKSLFYNPRGIKLAVSVNGIEQSRVIEYSISGGWIRYYETDEAGNIKLGVTGTMARVKRKFGEVKVWVR